MLQCLISYFINNIMGQNNSFRLNITDVIKEWVPLQSDPTIFINHNNGRHLQSYRVYLPFPDLLREIMIYNARIQAVYPHICKIAYFNQQDDMQQSGSHRFAVYTDHLFTLRNYQWNIQRFLHVIKAIITLTSYYGFFSVTQKMIFANERGETKIWISENPVHNHRDKSLKTEEEAVAAFAALATIKSYQVANLLIGCSTLKDVLIRLSSPQENSSSFFGTLSHRVEGVQKGKGKFFHNHISGESINNVSIEGPLLHKEDMNSLYNPSQLAISSRSVSQHQTQAQIKTKKHNYKTTSQNYKNTAQKKKYQIFPKTPKQRSKCLESPQFFTGKRYKSHIKMSSTSAFHSPKRRQTTNKCLPNFQSRFFPTKHTTEDITIINNNVNHVVNNITHHHSNHTSNFWNKFQNTRIPQFISKISPNKKENSHTPYFIQKKKEQNNFKNNIQQFYPTEYSSLPNPNHFFTQKNSEINKNVSTQQSFKNNDVPETAYKRNNKKLYTFSRPDIGQIAKKFSTSFSPHSQAPITPKQSKTHSNFFKKPTRTKTTDFSADSNSLILQPPPTYELDSSKIRGIHQFAPQYLPIPEDFTQNIVTSKSIPVRSPPTSTQQLDSEKNSLKNQLKLEFGNLLGLRIQQSSQNNRMQPTKGNIQQKIQQKRIAFAQLKKEALAVLTDLL